jgi:hypothetical protein
MISQATTTTTESGRSLVRKRRAESLSRPAVVGNNLGFRISGRMYEVLDENLIVCVMVNKYQIKKEEGLDG